MQRVVERGRAMRTQLEAGQHGRGALDQRRQRLARHRQAAREDEHVAARRYADAREACRRGVVHAQHRRACVGGQRQRAVVLEQHHALACRALGRVGRQLRGCAAGGSGAQLARDLDASLERQLRRFSVAAGHVIDVHQAPQALPRAEHRALELPALPDLADQRGVDVRGDAVDLVVRHQQAGGPGFADDALERCQENLAQLARRDRDGTEIAAGRWQLRPGHVAGHGPDLRLALDHRLQASHRRHAQLSGEEGVFAKAGRGIPAPRVAQHVEFRR